MCFSLVPTYKALYPPPSQGNKKLRGEKGIATRSKDATRAPGLATRSKKLLVAKGIATRSKDATGAPGLATRSKKLLVAKVIATRSKDATGGSWPCY